MVSFIGKRQMTCALRKRTSRWHGRMPNVHNCALGVQKADDMCNWFFSNKPMSSVYCSLRRCRLDIQDCTCDTLQFTTKRHMTWTHNRGKKHQKGMKTNQQKLFWEGFLISMIFLSMFDEFSPGSCQKLARKPRSCQKLENPLLTTFLIQILTERSWRENQDLAKNCQKSTS